MILNNSDYTTESVLKGHPDKICDQISDALLDAYLKTDKNAHTAIETLGCDDKIIVAGEIRSKADVNIENIVREVYEQVGYKNDYTLMNLLSMQSFQLDEGVANGRAGDQGVMYGYACKSECNYLPVGYYYANLLARKLDEYRMSTRLFLPDGKVQVTVREGIVEKVLINVQHAVDADLVILRKYIYDKVVTSLFSDKLMPIVEINKDEGFINGGFQNDTGLTGRKIIVDTYGGIAPHGGGAFSGKDPSKVDRSASYMARFVAKNIVANQYAEECLVSVAYEFGEENPSMLRVIVNGEDISKSIKKYFDFRPAAIIERLTLRCINYFPTATYGHFTDESYPWEEIIKI